MKFATPCLMLSVLLSACDNSQFVAGAMAGDLESSTDFTRPRVINMTDLGADPDDEQSLVRQLVMANEYDLEGLIVSTGCWLKSQESTEMLDTIVDAYAEAFPNLYVHSADFPNPEYLRSITAMGQTGYGMSDVGEGRDSVGSDMIIEAVDRDDPRPVWVMCWGGCNPVAQALWTVQQNRSEAQLAEFVSGLHVYDVLGQDDAGTWIAKTFPDLLYIRATGVVFGWQPTDEWLAENIQSHGPLGAVYPDRMYATEGDTPAFLHVYPNGLNDPTDVSQGGWGGRFEADQLEGVRGMRCMEGEDELYDPYRMYGDAPESGRSIARWRSAIENDFAARMDWSITAVYGDANHHPVAVLNGDDGRSVIRHHVSAGDVVALSAEGSRDPDGDRLGYSWSIYLEPSTYSGDVDIQNQSEPEVMIRVPDDASGTSIHVILEVSDNGEPSLISYRRMVLLIE